jgi:dUTP pyrophosphatase
MTDAAVLRVGVKLLVPGARLPERAYDGDAAYDLFAVGQHTLAPLARAIVGTGVALELPAGVCALTLPRSGLAARHGISIVNAPGLIDPGYRGELRIILVNTDAHESFAVRTGDRVAQLLFVELTPVRLSAVEALPPSSRGQRGFGSSGGFCGPQGTPETP